MIDRKHELSITRQAKALGVSRGSVYYLPRRHCQSKLARIIHQAYSVFDQA